MSANDVEEIPQGGEDTQDRGCIRAYNIVRIYHMYRGVEREDRHIGWRNWLADQ